MFPVPSTAYRLISILEQDCSSQGGSSTVRTTWELIKCPRSKLLQTDWVKQSRPAMCVRFNHLPGDSDVCLSLKINVLAHESSNCFVQLP